MSENVTSTPDEATGPVGDAWGEPTARRAVGPSGRYLLGGLLGRGGMADVYRAHDQTLGRAVAVKLLRERTVDPTDRARFVAEARLLARLNHPNLVTILDAGISEEHPFLVLELIEGSSLSGALTRTGQGLPPDRVSHIGAQIADALAHCHAAGIVHRDVKPGNILLGAGDRALLTDFGISRLLDGSAQHTQTGFTIGTASYLAPEQVHGDELTSAVDLYALGLVLLEACTGHREYTGTPVEAAIARLHRSPVIPPDLPPGLSGVLGALTRTDPTLRPDAAETARALTHGESSDLPTEMTAVPEKDTTSAKQHRRLPVFALLGWAAAAAAAIALVLTWHGASADPSTGTTSGPEKPAAASPSPSTRTTPAVKVSSGTAVSTSSGGNGQAKTRPATAHGKTKARGSTHAAAHTKPVKAKPPKAKPPKAHKSAGKNKHGGKNK